MQKKGKELEKQSKNVRSNNISASVNKVYDTIKKNKELNYKKKKSM